ncbi:hypothetical protein BRX37_23900 [Sphingomonas sp. S-NIH.Pt3_0716]|nr:hypothetical protein BRX37_23900 [Sphingomonas sp. S-NIH.Pt3_0716]
MPDIASPSPEIKEHLDRWARNRAVIQGEDAVKKARAKYLPKLPSQSNAQYLSYLASVDFFPAAQRTVESHIGLIMRKPPTVDAHETTQPILDTISMEYGLDDLGREILRETFITNFTGRLVDFPVSQDDVSQADAIKMGLRPFVAVYRAESILEVKREVIRNRFTITRVRLMEPDGKSVRELLLNDGRYEIIMHRKVEGGAWVPDEPIVPLKNNKPFDYIPFRIISTEAGSVTPSKAMADDIALMNLSHYRASAQHCNVLRHLGNPIIWGRGMPVSEDGKAGPLLSNSVEQAWFFAAPDAEVAYLEHSGNGVAALRQRCVDIAEQMAAIGARVLASEKAAAEAAETLAIRRASENSILASVAQRVADHVQEAANEALDWVGLPPITYAMNCDFSPVPMTSDYITALVAAFQAGVISHETVYRCLQDGEIVDFKRPFEQEKEAIAADMADRPSAMI